MTSTATTAAAARVAGAVGGSAYRCSALPITAVRIMAVVGR